LALSSAVQQPAICLHALPQQAGRAACVAAGFVAGVSAPEAERENAAPAAIQQAAIATWNNFDIRGLQAEGEFVFEIYSVCGGGGAPRHGC
jgi:hypothetical protein